MEKNANEFKTKIRILYITQSLGGGVQKFIIQLCQNLNQHQFQITGCCSAEQKGGDGDIPFSEAFRQIGISYFVVPMQRAINPWEDFSSFVKIYRNITRRGFDIVHAHSSKAGVLARIAARLAGVPLVIYSPHGFSFDGPGNVISKLPYILFEKIASFFSDIIITDSLSEKKLALKYKMGSDEKTFVVPPSINISDYNLKITGKERASCLKKLGIALENRVVTMIGRLAVQKDPYTFILAAKQIKNKQPDTTFLLVGDGPLMDSCLRLIKKLELEDSVKVVGWLRNYKIVLKASDIIVIPSLWEGLPFILLEAMAFAKPIVATRITGIVDVVRDGKNGFLIPPRSPDSLAKKVEQILDNPDVGANLGKEGRITVKKNYLLKTAVSSIETLYTRLFKKKVDDWSQHNF